MKKILIFFFVTISIGILLSSNNYITKRSNNFIITNTNALAEIATKSCSWRGFLGLRSCSVSCSGCSYVECSRKSGCYSQ